MKTKFKVGDKVRVRDDPNLNDRSDLGFVVGIVSEMLKLKGKTMTISEVRILQKGLGEVIIYRLEEDRIKFAWIASMLERYEEPMKEIDFKTLNKPSPNFTRFYLVEHVKGGKQYVFLGESGLSYGRKVICDTSIGNQEGTILREISLTEVITRTQAYLPLKWLVPKSV